MSQLKSQKPYLIRALYEWCTDSEMTPHIMVFVDDHTVVPRQFVKNNQIVLNIAYSAVKDLLIDEEWITFQATFSGSIQDLAIPVANVTGIFARENSQGMQFEIEPFNPTPPENKSGGGLRLVK